VLNVFPDQPLRQALSIASGACVSGLTQLTGVLLLLNLFEQAARTIRNVQKEPSATYRVSRCVTSWLDQIDAPVTRWIPPPSLLIPPEPVGRSPYKFKTLAGLKLTDSSKA